MRNLIVDLVRMALCGLGFFRCCAQSGVLRLAVSWAWPVQNFVVWPPGFMAAAGSTEAGFLASITPPVIRFS
jgi:hypothetical protein